MSDLVKLELTEKDIKDEVAVRMASEIFVWTGTEGAFLDAEKFAACKKKYECEVKEVDGVTLAVLSKMVKDPDWKAIAAEREKQSVPLQEYYQKVVRFHHVDHSISKLRLTNYYELGKFVADLCSAPGKYGNKSVETLADSLKVSEGALYQCQRFFERYKDQQRVLTLAEAEMPWRVVTKLLSIRSEDARTKIEDSWLEAQKKDKGLDERQLTAAIKKARKEETTKRTEAGESVDRRGGKGLKGLFDAVAQMSDRVQDKLSEFSEGYKSFNKLPKEKRDKELVASLKSAESSLAKLYKKLSKLIVEKPKDQPATELTGAAKKEN